MKKPLKKNKRCEEKINLVNIISKKSFLRKFKVKKSRIILITSIIFVLLFVYAYPSNVAAPEDRFEDKQFEIYDGSGKWYGSFKVRLRTPDQIRDRREAKCFVEMKLHEILQGSELIVNRFHWEINAGEHYFSDGRSVNRVLVRDGDKFDFDFSFEGIPDEFEGPAHVRFELFYDVVSGGQHIVLDQVADIGMDNIRVERNQPIPPEAVPFLIIIIIIVVVIALVVRRKRKTPGVVSTPGMTTTLNNPTTPAAMPTVTETQFAPGLISIKRGYETAGQYLKVGIKVENQAQTSITDVSVKIDVPAALEKVNPKIGIIELGVIKPRGSQSANFQLQPIRCVDDIITGIVMFRDAVGKLYTREMKPLELKSVCPMLTGDDVDAEWILMSLKKGKIKSNKANFKFDGDPKVAFAMAEARVRGLIPIDRDERYVGEHGDHYIAYASYIGRTKYGEFDFATEITVTGHAAHGLLTIAVYSNEESILSGFFYEVLQDVKKNVEITKETVHVAEQMCPECGGKLDMDQSDEEGYFRCAFCETMLRVPKWKR